jgi:hypothetical protein
MSDEWIKTLVDRRGVKFTTQEVHEKAFLTAQIQGNRVVYSIMLTIAKNRLVVKKHRMPIVASLPLDATSVSFTFQL